MAEISFGIRMNNFFSENERAESKLPPSTLFSFSIVADMDFQLKIVQWYGKYFKREDNSTVGCIDTCAHCARMFRFKPM